MKKNLNDYVEEIHSTIEEKIKIIKAIEYHYELVGIFKDSKKLSEKDKSKVLENIINKYLEKLKPIYTFEKYKKISKEVDEITDFFSAGNDDSIISEEDSVTEELLAKVTGKNNRKISLPINIEFIKDYCISSLIETKEIDKILLWIVLRLSTIHYCLIN